MPQCSGNWCETVMGGRGAQSRGLGSRSLGHTNRILNRGQCRTDASRSSCRSLTSCATLAVRRSIFPCSRKTMGLRGRTSSFRPCAGRRGFVRNRFRYRSRGRGRAGLGRRPAPSLRRRCRRRPEAAWPAGSRHPRRCRPSHTRGTPAWNAGPWHVIFSRGVSGRRWGAWRRRPRGRNTHRLRPLKRWSRMNFRSRGMP